MRNKSLAWFSACFVCFWVFVLSQFGCGVSAEEANPPPMQLSPGATSARPSVRPLEIRLTRHDELVNAPRIILGREYACLAAYEIWNPNDEAGYLSTFIISAQPAIAFDTVAIEWADDDVKLPRAAMPEKNGRVRIAYPNVGVQIKPQGSRSFRLCGVLKRVVGAGDGKGAEPESGTTVRATLLIAESPDGARARFMEEEESPRHVLRASLPRVTITPVSISELRAGSRTLFEWTVEAHWFGPIALKQFAFNVQMSDLTLCSVRLWDDSDDGPPDHDVVALTEERASSRNLRDACISQSSEIAVVFRKEYAFEEGQGVHFTLRANVATVGDASKLSVAFLRSNDAITDTLRCDDTGFALFSSDATMVPGITWSDISSARHSPDACVSSRDWTTDALLPNF